MSEHQCKQLHQTHHHIEQLNKEGAVQNSRSPETRKQESKQPAVAMTSSLILADYGLWHMLHVTAHLRGTNSATEALIWGEFLESLARCHSYGFEAT